MVNLETTVREIVRPLNFLQCLQLSFLKKRLWEESFCKEFSCYMNSSLSSVMLFMFGFSYIDYFYILTFYIMWRWESQ